MHFEKYVVIMDNRAMLEKKLNELNEDYEITVCGTSTIGEDITLILGLYPNYKAGEKTIANNENN